MKNLMQCFAMALILCSFSTTYAQVYERNPAQDINDFVAEVMPKSDSYLCSHQPIEGFWGDESWGEKIVFFYSDSLDNYVVVLQPVGKEKQQYAIINKVSVGIGAHPQNSKVISVFFDDVLGNGTNELLILTEAQEEEVVEEKENKVATTKSIYETHILQQVKDETSFQLLVNEIYPIDSGLGLEKLDLYNLKNAWEVRAALKKFAELPNDK